MTNDAGFIRQPKWGHLRDLHIAIKHCEDYLVEADPSRVSLGMNLEAHVYYKTSNDCAAFLANYDSKVDANVTFKGISYFLPAWSVSILPDCKNVVFNTAKVVSQKTLDDVSFVRNTITRKSSLASSAWDWYKERVGIWGSNSFTASGLLEQINTTKDASDFLWYTTSVNVDEKIERHHKNVVVLSIASLGHAALVFVNKRPVGFGYGNHDDASFVLKKKISLNPGNNTLDVLSMIVGLQNYGPWFDIQGAGVNSVVLSGLKNAKENLSSKRWNYQVGLEGESLGLYKVNLQNSSLWKKGNALPTNQSLIWYKGTFLAPDGKGPVSVDLSSMGKGQAWVNGRSIGRYWPAYHSPSTGCTDNCDYRGSYNARKCLKKCGQPTQTLYHIPRHWLHAGENILVLHEEIGGDPSKISLVTRTGQEICASLSEADLPPSDTWNPKVGFSSEVPQVRLTCDQGWHIASIRFASFGTPEGDCGAYMQGSCHANVTSIYQQACVGKQQCSVPVFAANLGDPCPGVLKRVAVQALCSV